jgi:hypothetical protein
MVGDCAINDCKKTEKVRPDLDAHFAAAFVLLEKADVLHKVCPGGGSGSSGGMVGGGGGG